MTKRQAVKKITGYRLAAGMTQQAAADKAGITQAAWSHAENEKTGTTWDTVLKMAAAVGLTAFVTIA